jgi:hypothetical protein
MRWPSCALNSQAKCEPIPGVEGGFYFPSAYEGDYQYFPKRALMTYRNSKLLRLCYSKPCHLRIPEVCTGGTNPDSPSVPAHSNMLRHGRGHGHKSNDCYSIPACPACHYWLDYGKASRQEKQAAFESGWEQWVLYCWENDLVEVA